MKKIITWLLLLALAGCNPQQYGVLQHIHADGKTHFEAHYDTSLFQSTDKKLFSVEMLVKGGKLVVGSNAVDIIIHGEGNRDVEEAVVTVTPWMTEHGHGLMKQPVTIERGAGLYTVSGIDLMMAGKWELKIQINANNLEDATSFLFPDVQPPEIAGGGHPSQIGSGFEEPAEIDYSVRKISDGGHFNISFTANPAKIPLNKIHSWQLNLLNTKGEPINGARIRVSGDMPAHGHGLPTQPVITGEPKPGQYLVEGMKFNMPGLWTVTFGLIKEGISDSVTFNLQIR